MIINDIKIGRKVETWVERDERGGSMKRGRDERRMNGKRWRTAGRPGARRPCCFHKQRA